MKPEIPKNGNRIFQYLLINTLLATVTNMTVWFALVFFVYLQTQAVLATAIISGIYLVAISFTGFWFGGVVDRNKKKNVMLASSIISLASFITCFFIYISAGADAFKNMSNPILWIFIVAVMVGVVAGNLRSISLSTLVSVLIEEKKRDKANGLIGSTFGVAFLVVSVISGLLVGHSGMFLVLILASLITVLTAIHIFLIKIDEKNPQLNSAGEIDQNSSKLDIKGTIAAIKIVPGLLSLILFTTFNNFLGGVFMSLMDAYGLSLVSVEIWGLLWGILSTAFIIGGFLIAKFGLGKNPLWAMFRSNLIIWFVSIFFTIQPSIILLMIGMFIYLAVIPFIEAAEHTIIQKVVPLERQGRVFGFAQSIEQAASPLTSFLIGPIAQFIFIPFMTTGAGVGLIGGWFGTGPDRGIALVFTITGIIGLIVTLLAMRTKFYKQLSEEYAAEEIASKKELKIANQPK